MSQRITPEMVRSSTLETLSSTLSSLERTTDELSSGRTILEPSDNPYGASRVIDLQSQLDGLSSYEQNAQLGSAWTNTAMSAMSSMNSSVQRVRELVLQAANGTYNKSNVETIGLQIEQLTEGIKQAVGAQFGGEYIFSGTATLTPPYQAGANDEYQGDEGAVSRSVGPGSSINISTPLQTLLGNGPEAKDGKLLDTLRTIVKNLKEGSAESVSEVANANLKALDANIETLSNLQASAGSATDQLQTALTRGEQLQSSIAQGLSNTEDTNVAATSIQFANEQAAYDAALRAGATIVQESLLNFLH